MPKIFVFLVLIACVMSFATSCSEEKCTVVFIVNDNIYHSASVLKGECVFAPAEPVVDGYKFCGWYYGSAPWKSGDAVFESMTLIASFEEILDNENSSEEVLPEDDGNEDVKDDEVNTGDDGEDGKNDDAPNVGGESSGGGDIGGSENEDSDEQCSHKVSEWIIDLGASCISEGKKHIECTVCGLLLVEETIPRGEHSYVIKTEEPTCEVEGKIYYACKLCSDSFVSETVAPKGHTLVARVTEPSCTERGFTTYTCTACDYEKVSDYKDALPHSFCLWYSSPEPSCSERGGMRRDCAVCGEYEYIEVAPLGHEYAFGICLRCGANESFKPKYELTDDGRAYKIIGAYELYSGNVIIPDYYNGLPVTAIGSLAFAENQSITEVKLGSNIKVIEGEAFIGCSSLECIVFNEGLSVIEERVFFGCDRIVSLDFPDGLYEIGALAFAMCSSLSEAYIPESVEVIGRFAFEGCSSLRTVTFARKVRWYLYELKEGIAVKSIEPADDTEAARLLRSSEYGFSDYYWIR